MEHLRNYPITGSAEFNFARMTYHESISMIRLEITRDITFTLKETKMVYDAAQQLSGGARYHMLIVIEVRFKPERDIYDFLSSDERKKRVLSEVFAMSSGMLRILYNFYVRMKKPGIPTRAFNNEADAFAWIQEISLAQNE